MNYEEILPENLKLLIKYLLAIGCPKSVVYIVTANLRNEVSILHMLQFCKEHPDASPEEIIKASSKISSEFPMEED